MKIAVISDLHLGHGAGSELEEDAFSQASEALDLAIAQKADLILLPGDIFDSRVPRQEVWARAFELFQKPLLAEKNHTKLVGLLNRQEPPRLVFSGIPVVAIHGTHERRGTHSVNPVSILENAGFLIHLHCSGVVFEAGGERVAIQGLSGVPDAYVKKVLEEWNPQPVPGAVNFLVLHQSFKEYIYSDDESPMLCIQDLPKGFDAYINGHIHWSDVAGKFFMPGSTVITQQKKTEAERKKGFLMFDVSGGRFSHSFVELKTQRAFLYEKLEFSGADGAEVVLKARACLEKLLSGCAGAKKPKVLLKLEGSVKPGTTVCEEEITRGFDALITVSNEIETDDLKKKIEKLRELQAKKLSVQEMGLDLINKMLKETNYEGLSPEEVLELLAEGENDAVIQKVFQRFEAAQKH